MTGMAPNGSASSARRLFLANGILRKLTMSGGWLPLSVRLVVDLDFSALQLLLMGTAIELAILLGEVPTGVMADVFSRKWSVVLGAFFLSAAQFASGLADEWTLYLVTQFVWGIGWTFISGAEIAWLTDEIGSVEETESVLLLRGRLEFAAVVVGILLFGALSLLLPLATAVMIAGGIGLVWTLVLAIAMPETNFSRTAGRTIDSFTKTFREGGRFVWRHKALRILGLALICGGMAAEAMDRLNLRRLEDLGLSSETSPVMVFALVMLTKALLGGLVLWRFQHRFEGRRVVTGFAAIIAAVGILSILLAQIPILAFAVCALIAQGGLLDVTDPLIGTWTNALAPAASRATVHSFIGQTRAFGEILGGVTLGAVAALSTLPVAWTAAGFLFLIAAANASSARHHWDPSG